MSKSESRFVSQEVQTDNVLSKSLFATKSELDDVKIELLEKLTRLKEGRLDQMNDFGSSERADVVQDDNPTPTDNFGVSPQPNPTLQNTPLSVDSGPVESQSQSQPEFSSVQFSSVQFSSVQFSSVQFSSVQFSSVQFSSVQFSSVQFSSVQFSSVQVILHHKTIYKHYDSINRNKMQQI